MTEKAPVLVVHDDGVTLAALKATLESIDRSAETATDPDEAMKLADWKKYSLILLDVGTEGCNIEAMRAIKEGAGPNSLTPFVAMSSRKSDPFAVEAFMAGADNHLPLKDALSRWNLLSVVNQAVALLEWEEDGGLAGARAEAEWARSRQAPPPPPLPSANGLVWRSEAFGKTIEEALSVARSDSTVLLTGESGTGKGCLARLIWKNSRRANGLFVVMDCRDQNGRPAKAISPNGTASAFDSIMGMPMWEAGGLDGGTMFLERVCGASEDFQARLLMPLNAGVFRSMISGGLEKANMRFIASAENNLGDLASKGAFLDDLNLLLNVKPIAVPPLRERPGDAEALFGHFVALYAKRLGKKIQGLGDEALETVRNYPWPGNVSELRAAARRAAARSEGPRVTAGELGKLSGARSAPRPAASGWPFAGLNPLTVANALRRAAECAMARHGGDTDAAAEDLGLSRWALDGIMRRLGIG
ncbi:MAG: sigma 54-interacting transcriptional regulator [Deltaproteobacteria bacterium]|jgi:DNA-binding NtrC family response regulator|nr:sigma 54-interacting transcriptional regulator [Deltaproteobacteria bacterium]